MPSIEFENKKQFMRLHKMTLLETAYRVYYEERMIKSQQEFSTNILGMGPSYFSCMKARRRSPRQSVLEHLLKQTRLFLFSCKRNPHFGKRYSVSLNRTHDRLDILANSIEQELLLCWGVGLYINLNCNQQIHAESLSLNKVKHSRDE